MSGERRPKLEDVILKAVKAGVRSVGIVIPAKVVKWDADKQRADCQPLVKEVTKGEDDAREVNSSPVVTGVPVQFFAIGPFRLTGPISDGNLVINGNTIEATTGSLFYSHRSIDKWLSGNGGEVDPEFDHDHGPNDCIFIPGLRAFGNAFASVPSDRMTLGIDNDATVQIHLYEDKGILGDPDNAEFMFLCQTMLADLKDFITILNTVLLAGTVGGPTAQQLSQASQIALTQMYIRLQASTSAVSAYLSTKWKNK